MAEVKQNCPTGSNTFKEAVCIDAGRVYDSCCDRDCIEDLRVRFSSAGNALIKNSTSIKVKEATVAGVNICLEPVAFNRGFYSCDLTFNFLISFDVCTSQSPTPSKVYGYASYEKKVILYGSEGNVKVFESDECDLCDTSSLLTDGNSPKCVVQCVDPIALSMKVCTLKDCLCNSKCPPKCICDFLGGDLAEDAIDTPAVYVTLGLFSIIQLIRNVQMLVPVYDFCIPEKQCTDSTDNPCDVFSRISFPTDDFFPPRPCNVDSGCGCSDNQ